jgi:hypothetical protein
MRIEATASFGSHSGPTAFEPSMPNADITERCRSGKESGDGTLSGEVVFTAKSAVPISDTQPDALQVASTHLKSLASSNHKPVVVYILTPSPVTAAGSHLKS